MRDPRGDLPQTFTSERPSKGVDAPINDGPVSQGVPPLDPSRGDSTRYRDVPVFNKPDPSPDPYVTNIAPYKPPVRGDTYGRPYMEGFDRRRVESTFYREVFTRGDNMKPHEGPGTRGVQSPYSVFLPMVPDPNNHYDSILVQEPQPNPDDFRRTQRASKKVSSLFSMALSRSVFDALRDSILRSEFGDIADRGYEFRSLLKDMVPHSRDASDFLARVTKFCRSSTRRTYYSETLSPHFAVFLRNSPMIPFLMDLGVDPVEVYASGSDVDGGSAWYIQGSLKGGNRGETVRGVSSFLSSLDGVDKISLLGGVAGLHVWRLVSTPKIAWSDFPDCRSFDNYVLAFFKKSKLGDT